MTEHDSDHIAHLHDELHSHLPSEPALRAKALESLLVEKGLVDSAAVDAWVEAYSEDIGPKNGGRIVARSWVDPDFKARLLEDACEAIKELGLEHVRDPRGVLDEFGVKVPESTRVRVWDSTAELRYLVVPQRPAGTDGWDENKLASLVSRNSMIGTHRDLSDRVQGVS